MNEARTKVESFKNRGNFQDLMKTILDVKLPENFKSLGFGEQNKAQEEATDDAIARHLGVAITDKETWPEERTQSNIKAWVEGLPDK